ncbi:substrate-binding domain-containing protein [Jannaschia rubra]|uniref:PBP superfamily domain protein n=1 Tax=Jannaschia rubra TaxID=282197 RepID=A0A0M6XPT2_9RHOB|nr:substrate-binding domain-containing protein [Jannaschia rubra]CTQ33186.1 PBP superfamily domain protein [Jannaschia rubra]SFF96495.1 tungstate transport system substrate-binding protein [Jannaschia rubra]
MTRIPLLAAALSILLPIVAAAETMKMAVTTSFQNSGLAEVLVPRIAEETGVDVELIVVGTGQALRLGEAGDVDAVLVHSRAAEEAFVAAGHATHRTPFMYNDFVVLGPVADPADVTGAGTAPEAMTRIAAAEASFVSRGDDSGTHKAELALWEDAGMAPEGTWYRPVGAGMGASLNTAVGMGAYILSDRATWLNFDNKADMAILFEGDPALFNQYAYLPVNPAKGDHLKADAAGSVENWLVSATARDLIDGYRVGGEQVFTFNAEQ